MPSRRSGRIDDWTAACMSSMRTASECGGGICRCNCAVLLLHLLAVAGSGQVLVVIPGCRKVRTLPSTLASRAAGFHVASPRHTVTLTIPLHLLPPRCPLMPPILSSSSHIRIRRSRRRVGGDAAKSLRRCGVRQSVAEVTEDGDLHWRDVVGRLR